MKYYQLLILGNGFDVHCGLQSKYKDFFRNALLDTIGEPFGVQQLKVGVSGFWENLLLEYYKKYGNKDYKWCDIEQIIKDTLSLIFVDDKNTFDRQSVHGLWYHAVDTLHYKRNPEDVLKSIDSPINRYIFLYCVKFFNTQQYDIAPTEKRKLLLDHILQSLYNFERRFCEYIKANIVNPENPKEINTHYIVNAVNLLARITGFSTPDYQDIEDIISEKEEQFAENVKPTQQLIKWRKINVLEKEFSNLKATHILSFNYTAIFDFLSVESPCIYSNVHGKLCNNTTCEEKCKSSVIFGVDDALIQSKSDFADLRLFSKTYRKMFDTSATVSILPLIDENAAITIKFYGHSLNEADYSYFQSIFDYYNLYGNARVALVFYYSKGFEQTDSIYRLINTYGTTLPNKAQGKNLMHKLLLENRLKIIEID